MTKDIRTGDWFQVKNRKRRRRANGRFTMENDRLAVTIDDLAELVSVYDKKYKG